MLKTKRGFTLIELLVVIAIIGILASIVLVSFPGATKRARDSRVISAIAQARTEMTSYNANNATYVGFGLSQAIEDEVGSNSYNETTTTMNMGISTAGGCMYAPLGEKDGTTWYCADSTGIAGKTSIDPSGGAAAGTCEGTSYKCPTGTSI